MSTVERKEYQQTQILRTVSPVRTTRSTQNLSEFDSNLDNLLEDLQSSVSRPGSALGNSTYKETTKTVNGFDSSNSLNRVTHMKASNPVTEYSSDDAYTYTSPDGKKHVKTFKKESYSYKTGGDQLYPEKLRENGVSQLDSLLDDLQQVKQHSFEKEVYNSAGRDPGYSEKSQKSVQRELHYGETPRSGSRSRTYERTFEKEGSLTRDVQYSSSEGTYGDINRVRHSSPSPTRSNTSTLSRQAKVTNVHTYPLEVQETTVPDINSDVLAHLDPHLLPTGNTKVTTTIKTYTYEIPGSNVSTTEKESYNYSALNQSQTTPSKSFVYSKNESAAESAARYTNKESSRDFEERVYKEYSSSAPPYQKPSSPVGSDRTLIKETVTTRNYQPGYSPELQRREPHGKPTYVYNETINTRNYQNEYPNQHNEPLNYQPERRTHTLTKQTQTNVDYPPNQPAVLYKQETHSTNKYSSGDGQLLRDVEIINTSRPPYSGKAPQKEPVNISYQYKSHSATTNNFRGEFEEEREPLLHPQPFPKDAEQFGVPKKVDQLMATIGHEPPNSAYNASFNVHEAEVKNYKKVEELKQHDLEVQKKEPKDLAKTKNVTGPPVYYPPGHEMFAKKEESAAWRAEGAMAHEKAKYQYEAQEKSKSKGRSGAAIVPVCLPLCCGLPCTIL